MRAVDGVLFDVDDTLVDTRGAFVHALAAVAGAYLPAGAADRVDEMLATWRADAGGYYRAYTRGELGFVEQRLLRANQLHELFGGPALSEADFAAWDAVFDAGFVAGWRAHEDASPLVDLLLGAGLPVGALSSAGVGGAGVIGSSVTVQSAMPDSPPSSRPCCSNVPADCIWANDA